VPFAGAADNATNAIHAAASAALDKVSYRSAAGSAPPSTVSAGATAACDPGQRVVGGGVRVDNPAPVYPVDSYPEPGGTGWTAHIGTDDSDGTGFTVTAICVPASAAG
jgi:hypothetical protein